MCNTTARSEDSAKDSAPVRIFIRSWSSGNPLTEMMGDRDCVFLGLICHYLGISWDILISIPRAQVLLGLNLILKGPKAALPHCGRRGILPISPDCLSERS